MEMKNRFIILPPNQHTESCFENEPHINMVTITELQRPLWKTTATFIVQMNQRQLVKDFQS